MHTGTYTTQIEGEKQVRYNLEGLTDEQLSLIREALIEANFTTVNMMNTKPELLTVGQKAKLKQLLFQRQEILRELPHVEHPRPLDGKDVVFHEL